MTVYRAGSASDYQIAPLDDLTLVYHRPAGATHLLAEPAPELLAALFEGPADVATVFDRLAARFALDPAAREGLTAHLDELVAAGLVATT